VDLGAEVGAYSSFKSKRVETAGDDFHVSAATWEFAVGPRAAINIGDTGLSAYLGAGLSFIFAGIDVHGHDDDSLDVDDSDTSPAFYAHTGMYYRFAKHFSAGFDIRVLRASDIELFGTDGDADYDQFTLFGGYSF
jgi:hypothetical protein